VKDWSTAARDALWSGAAASLASTLMLSLCGEREKRSPLAPTNVTSRWIWGRRAEHKHGASLRYTATGYAIHHAMSTLWALVYEKWVDPRVRHAPAPVVLASGLAMGTLSCFTDYKLTPERLEPGFDRHLSKTSLALSYGAFGLALAAHTLFFCNRRKASS
jgi:hypothetical protein